MVTLLGCTPSSPNRIIRKECGAEALVSERDVISAYNQVILDLWKTERGDFDLFFRSCGTEILVYEKIPVGFFGGSTYVYFDAETLVPQKITAFQ